MLICVEQPSLCNKIVSFFCKRAWPTAQNKQFPSPDTGMRLQFHEASTRSSLLAWMLILCSLFVDSERVVPDLFPLSGISKQPQLNSLGRAEFIKGNSLSGILALLACLDMCSCTKYQDRAFSNISLTIESVTEMFSSSGRSLGSVPGSNPLITAWTLLSSILCKKSEYEDLTRVSPWLSTVWVRSSNCCSSIEFQSILLCWIYIIFCYYVFSSFQVQLLSSHCAERKCY